MKSGNLNFLEPSGPLQVCNGTDLPFYLNNIVYYQKKFVNLFHTGDWGGQEEIRRIMKTVIFSTQIFSLR